MSRISEPLQRGFKITLTAGPIQWHAVSDLDRVRGRMVLTPEAACMKKSAQGAPPSSDRPCPLGARSPLPFPLTYLESWLIRCVTHWRRQPEWQPTLKIDVSSSARSMTSLAYPPTKIYLEFMWARVTSPGGDAICRDPSQTKRNILNFRRDVRAKHIRQGG
jgi:hypothetical protein